VFAPPTPPFTGCSDATARPKTLSPTVSGGQGRDKKRKKEFQVVFYIFFIFFILFVVHF
jgi:hypothetical protein